MDLILGAQVYLTDEANGLSFEEKLAELGKFDSRRQESVWFQPTNQTKTQVVLSNTSDLPLSVTARLSKRPTHAGTDNVFLLAPHETKVLDLQEDFSDGQQFANADVVGLSMEHSGAKGDLLARVMIADRGRGYSNLSQFSNPNGGKSSEYQGVGFQIDEVAGLRVTPVIVAKNVGTQSSTVTVTVPYARVNGTTGTINLSPTNLQAGESKSLDVRQIVQRARQEHIKIASLEVTYNAAPGSVIVNAHSQSGDGEQVFRVPMWDPFAQRSPTGGYPWRIEGASTTRTYIKNITDREQYYVAFLNLENGEKYTVGMRAVAPHQTVEIDVKKLRDEQIPDEAGHVIPLDATRGQLKWSLKRTGDAPAGEESRALLALIGRTEEVDLENGISSNYACQNWCESSYLESYLTPSDPEAEVGEQVDFNAYQNDMDHYGDETGFYQRLLINTYGPTYWYSSQTSVATISSSSIATVVAPGTTTITASWQDYNPPVGTICDPQRLEMNDKGESSEDQTRKNVSQPNALEQPCEACASYSILASANVVLIGKPKVRIDEFKAVGKNSDNASVRIVVEDNPDNASITLSLTPRVGTGVANFASNNSTALTITQTTIVAIKGITESSTNDNMRLEAKYNNRSVDTEDFTVVSAVLSLRFDNNDDISTDNDKKQNHISATGRSKLGGPFFVTGTGINKIWGHAIEIVGTILPNNYSGDIILQREVVESKTYQGSTLIFSTACDDNIPTPCADTSFPDFLDSSVSSQGRVYDLDNPGFDLVGASNPGTIRRKRTNFRQWATVSQKDAGTTKDVRISADVTWFHRLSVQYVGTPATQLSNDVSNDNEIGSGTTRLTWNLLP